MIGRKKSVNTMLSVLCLLILFLLMPQVVLAPFLHLLFTPDELTDMGIHIDV